MRKATISIPKDLAQIAQLEAQRRGVTLSAVIRHALEEHLYKNRGSKLPWQDLVNRDGAVARDLDTTLDRGWTADFVGDR